MCVVCCLVFGVWHVLVVAGCGVLFAARCSLLVVCCLAVAVWCVLFAH